jgi:uncharacterized membrane protein
MNHGLLFLHFVGLVLGAGPGAAQGLIIRRAAILPADQAQVLRGVGPLLANVSAVGIAVLWITGVIMVWSKWSGPSSLPSAFWIKLVFVILLTLISGYVHLTYAEVRRGNAAAALRFAWLGPAASVSALLAILFAVITFY